MSSAVAGACFSISAATNNSHKNSSSRSPLPFPSIAFIPSRGRRSITLQRRCYVGSKPTILVAEKIGEDGLKVLEGFANVDCSYDMTPEELYAKVSLCDALIVHSETIVGRKVFEASRGRLKVVGRAGAGFDNVGLRTATEFGCLVVKAPRPNTIAAAEHAIALMTAMAQAEAKAGDDQLEMNKLVGKTLLVYGLGNVGAEVARRAKGLGMRVLALDPFVVADRARAIGADLVRFSSLSAALANADFISLHLPFSERTWITLSDHRFAIMKKGVCIVNVSHGGLIHEDGLVKALDSGIVARAAIDVFTEDIYESFKYTKLLQHERVTVIPHLAASTQKGVSTDLAEAVVGALNGGGELAATAFNAPMVSPEVPTELKPYVELAEVLGNSLRQVASRGVGGLKNVKITYASARAADDLDTRLLRAMVIKGILEPISSELYVNLANADLIAKQKGMRLSEEFVFLDGSPESPFEKITVQLDIVKHMYPESVYPPADFKVEGKVKDGRPYLIKKGRRNVERNCSVRRIM
ncbi:PREDICTED: D-3-phosphoglycerate dehydrogenase 1, chloroplastic-like [Camelina sativa]|uniref:D-3-phosphoglycerate dehydrogenase 1, chloroplastic-like n=1 Tax=Camelina sativa TaxID=90675 RepID=A0ABM0V5N0_CAMSA|nr:PREDICTED: D-3-phosphoglycerate dehydrogenase 1, chloroplastic-like [Camelina sativa]